MSLIALPMLFSCGGEKDDKNEDNAPEKEITSQAESDEQEVTEKEEIQLSYRDLGVDEFALYGEDPDAVVLDVRTSDEWNSNGIIDSNVVMVDWYDDAFKSKVESEIPKDKSVYVYCHGGGRSAEAADSLISLGYNNVYNLEEGFMSWKSAGKDIIKITAD